MKVKPIFYLNGNERNFRDHYSISLRTGEPMPKKWQRYIELTPEEKARWDAELKLDEEYRIAEAQGFPNGIPGGKMRGNILYTITQREDGEKRKLQEENQQGRFFSPQKTEIQNNNGLVAGNIPNYKQNNLLKWKTEIKKESDDDLARAIHRAGNTLKEILKFGDGQTDASTFLPNGQGDSLMQAFNQNYYDAVALSYGNGGSPRSVISSNTSNGMNYSNGPIYSHGGDDISAEVEEFVKSLARKALADLAGIAATIVAVVTAKWKFGRDITAGADTMIMVLALCHIAGQTQNRWEIEKTEDTSVAKIFGEEAMKYLVEEGVGNFIKRKHSSEILAFVASMMTGDLIDKFLEENAPQIFPQDVKTWERFIKEEILD